MSEPISRGAVIAWCAVCFLTILMGIGVLTGVVNGTVDDNDRTWGGLGFIGIGVVLLVVPVVMVRRSSNGGRK